MSHLREKIEYCRSLLSLNVVNFTKKAGIRRNDYYNVILERGRADE